MMAFLGEVDSLLMAFHRDLGPELSIIIDALGFKRFKKKKKKKKVIKR
jgi:ABC-type cobalt transport system substrate-binding protein